MLLSVAFQSLHKAVIVSGYYANTEAYAKNCINKLRPQLNCNGKCQMMKKIQEEEKKEAEAFSKKGQSVDWTSPATGLNLPSRLVYIETIYGFFHCGSISGFSTVTFHPPGSSAV